MEKLGVLRKLVLAVLLLGASAFGAWNGSHLATYPSHAAQVHHIADPVWPPPPILNP